MSTAEPTPKVREVDLGAEASIGELPFPLSIDEDDYFLSRGKSGEYRLLSAICPHSWGEIVRWDNCFMCPSHGWRFELKEGVCLNGPRSQMYNFPVNVRNGQLYAEVPEDKTKWV
jgi:nitrite reductase/ring-hydroxylating ferredoxin subunit